MKNFFLLLLLPFSLIAFQTKVIPTWPVEVNKTIETLKPKFKTTSSKFSSIAIHKTEIGGNTNKACWNCPNLEPLAIEAYQKKLTLSDSESGEKFYIFLQILVTENPEQAEHLKDAISDLRNGRSGTDLCPQSILEKKPFYSLVYRNTVIIIYTWYFRNYVSFKPYAEDFIETLKKQL